MGLAETGKRVTQLSNLGKQRNHARLLLMSMAYNLKRGLAIQRSCMAGG